MTYVLFWSAISFFAALGVYFFVREAVKAVLKNEPSFVLLTVKNRENDIEYSIRSLLYKYPESKIIIADRNSDDRTLEIARRMSMMYDRVEVCSRMPHHRNIPAS